MNSLLFTLLLVSPVACRAIPPEPVAFVVQNGVTASSTGSGEGYTQLSVDEGKGQLLVILHDKSVTALLDGKVLPGERVVRDGDKLTIRDVDGSTLYEVRVLDDSHSLVYPYDADFYVTTPDGVNWMRPGGGGVAAFSNTAPRRKLIGVNTASVDSALRAQLGITGDAFVIESVNDDMPAARAGAQPWDVVTAIDGDPGATTEKLREALDRKQPGDTLGLTVLRGGKSVELKLTVEEPRATTMYWPGITAQSGWRGADAWSTSDNAAVVKELLARSSEMDAEREKLSAQLAQLEAQSKALGASHGADAEKRQAELAAEQAKVTARQAEIEAELARRNDAMAYMQQGQAGNRWLVMPSGQGGAVSVATGPGASNNDDRLKLLEERLARLEELLERLAAREPSAPKSGEEPGQKP
jgi:hypothetical protein